MKTTLMLAALALGAQTALAAPKIDNMVVKPNSVKFEGGKAPEVEVAVSVSRTRFDTGGCDARIDFGDGEGRNVDFGMAGTRTVRHAYKKNGSYKVSVKGAGATPCEGAREAPLTVAGAPEPKKDEKKADAKKADAKKAPAKKAPPKKAPAKKAPPKQDEKKDETK